MAKNLYTPADGIFDSHVTWKDIEEDMQRTFDTVAIFGCNKAIKNIGEGNGFMSRICLVEPDWQCTDKHLPKRFIIKIFSLIPLFNFCQDTTKDNDVTDAFKNKSFLQTLENTMIKLHNAEVNFYSQLAKLPHGKIPLATVYIAKKFSDMNLLKGYIIMEFMENIETIHIFNNLEPNTLRQPLRAAAVIAAISVRLTDEENASFTKKPFREIFSEFYKPDVIESLITMLNPFGDEKLMAKINCITGIASEFMNPDLIDQIPDNLGMTRVLCHGDLWSANLLWRKAEGKSHSLAAIIDFQTVHLGCPAADLCLLFSACLSGKDRQERWEELLEDFYRYLEHEVDGEDMPFTLEQLKEAYRRLYPIIGFMLISMAGPILNVITNMSEEEEKQERLDVVMEKIEHILDDVIKYYSSDVVNPTKCEEAS